MTMTTNPRAVEREAIFAAQTSYDVATPYLSPGSRWQRALRLVQAGRRPSPQYHDEWVGRAFGFVCQRRGLEFSGMDDTSSWLAAIETAWQVYRQRNLDTAILEARLLAKEPIADIANRSSLPKEAVLAFAKLFFDVEPRYDCKGWIVNMAIRYPSLPKTPTLGALLRKFGYFAGADFLERMIPYVRKFAEQPLRTEPLDLDTEEGRTEAAFRRVFLLELTPLNKEKAQMLMKLHPTITTESRSGDSPDEVQSKGVPLLDNLDQLLQKLLTERDLERIRRAA